MRVSLSTLSSQKRRPGSRRTCRGKLNLVGLAGPERLCKTEAKGQRRKDQSVTAPDINHRPNINEDPKDTLINQFVAEIDPLKRQLQEENAVLGGGALFADAGFLQRNWRRIT
jgi:hypothetical protein